MGIKLRRPDSAAHWREARRLIDEYAASLDIDLCFQGFENEVRQLPQEYGPPWGAFLLAEDGGDCVGCIGLRPFSGSTGEVKRLYVVPAARGSGAGRALAEEIVVLARQLGYARLVLDTLPSMLAARALYESLGFRPIAPYRFNPVPGVVYRELLLR